MTQMQNRTEGPPVTMARRPGPGRMVVLGVAIVAAVLVVALGLRWYLEKRQFVETDDAFVSGNLVGVSARIGGQVKAMHVDEGQQVKANQVIAELDPTDLQAQVNQAQANLQVAESNLNPSEQGVNLQEQTSSSQVAQAQAGVSAARANRDRAAADYERIRGLFKSGAVSHQQLDAARAQADATEAQYVAARATLAQAQAGTTQVTIRKGNVQTTRAQVAQAEAALKTAKLQLEHATITSPVTGLVVKRAVNAGEMVTPGQPLFTIEDLSQVWVVANVPETDIHRVAQGAAVELTVDAFPGKHFHGHVAEVIGATGSEFSLLPQNNAAGNFTKVVQRIPVKITVDDAPQIEPGMSAVIKIKAR